MVAGSELGKECCNIELNDMRRYEMLSILLNSSYLLDEKVTTRKAYRRAKLV